MKDEYLRKAKVVNIVDGDTFDVDIKLGYGVVYKDRLRLHKRKQKGYKLKNI